jgi:hypothetical protein
MEKENLNIRISHAIILSAAVTAFTYFLPPLISFGNVDERGFPLPWITYYVPGWIPEPFRGILNLFTYNINFLFLILDFIFWLTLTYFAGKLLSRNEEVGGK